MNIDTSPRPIWTGLTIPGKKMAKMLTPDHHGILLLDLYKGGLHDALQAVAFALHYLPTQGGFGPKASSIHMGLPSPLSLYGATLTDVRDFLKLRFRTSGLEGPIAPSTIATEFGTSDYPDADPLDPAWVVNYLISGIDALASDERLDSDTFDRALLGLTRIARISCAQCNPLTGLDPRYDELVAEWLTKDFEE